ncbi:phosphoribosylaminoimidazolesuccinocarboxamide synthase [Allobaculum mucilyticum]|uniref:phosphoribosylaminoimidazolesuccinocarboxamide synthase n=1 Tax=Allobaculum mucilyticum TaxID=2834459 RepID=UPI001E60BB20|nr:phosphoribosylaminoimidazolesuccinocarboxamide synthase [Allobaculum mucilyticum]UNT96487.1 phosphoribosylaminoimidazolesuccinocarboxamide synthase [Allobaculum mucilyticum]
MEQKEQLYEGKAKKVFATDNPELVIVDYKDDATAFNGLKKGTIKGKGAINNRMTNYLMKVLEGKGVPTHLVEEIDDRKTVVKKVDIIPLEVIIRNKAAGSFSKRLGIPEGSELKCSTLEFSYKDDDLGDPLINSYMARAIGAATQEEIDTITRYAFTVNEVLKEFFDEIGIELIDFKLEFGKTSDGTIVLADEISPDTCRYWDKKTGAHLDKDTFRRDLGNPEGAYQEVFRRMGFDA